MTDTLRIGLVYGSARPGRLCDSVAGWVAERVAARGGMAVETIDPAAGHDEAELIRRIDRADGFIVVTPEYNHSFPAPLKALIDAASSEWHAKPVAFVSYGGISGGLRAVEHLRGVFAELHAVGIRDTVSFAAAWEQFGEDAQLHDPRRAERAMATLLLRFDWWSRALRNARIAQSYGEAA
ncbi:NAD(P)H-dependent oxidoreductase [Pelagerythrobacter marensis]|uniref:NAD(P)H-dependent oxidoreductase n=1 Tax=Pelagerythrobacter marensis TaxID=543877 RepID=A0ABZ2D579_9SPHN